MVELYRVLCCIVTLVLLTLQDASAVTSVNVIQRPDGLWSVRVGLYTVDSRSSAGMSLPIPVTATLRGFSLLHDNGLTTVLQGSVTAGKLGDSLPGIYLSIGLNDKSNQLFPTPSDTSWDPRVTVRSGYYYTVAGVNPLTDDRLDLFRAPTNVTKGSNLLVWFNDQSNSYSDNGGVAQYWVDIIVQSDAGAVCGGDARCLSGSCRGGRCCSLTVNGSVCNSCDVGGSCNGCVETRQLAHAMGCVATRGDGLYNLSMPGTYAVESTTTLPSAPIVVPMNVVLRGVRLTYVSGSTTTHHAWTPGRFGDNTCGAEVALSVGGSANIIAPNASADARIDLRGFTSASCFAVRGVDLLTAPYIELYTAPTLVTAGTHLTLWYRDAYRADNAGTPVYSVDLIFESYTGGRCTNDTQCPSPDRCNGGTCGVFRGSVPRTCRGLPSTTAVPLALTCLLSPRQNCTRDAECFSNDCQNGQCRCTSATAMFTTQRADGLYGVVVPSGAMIDATTGANQTWVAPVDMVVAGMVVSYNSGGVTHGQHIASGTFAATSNEVRFSAGFTPPTAATGISITYMAKDATTSAQPSSASIALVNLSPLTQVTRGSTVRMWFDDGAYTDNRGTASYSWQLLVQSFAGMACTSSAQCPALQPCSDGYCGRRCVPTLTPSKTTFTMTARTWSSTSEPSASFTHELSVTRNESASASRGTETASRTASASLLPSPSPSLESTVSKAATSRSKSLSNTPTPTLFESNRSESRSTSPSANWSHTPSVKATVSDPISPTSSKLPSASRTKSRTKIPSPSPSTPMTGTASETKNRHGSQTVSETLIRVAPSSALSALQTASNAVAVSGAIASVGSASPGTTAGRINLLQQLAQCTEHPPDVQAPLDWTMHPLGFAVTSAGTAVQFNAGLVLGDVVLAACITALHFAVTVARAVRALGGLREVTRAAAWARFPALSSTVHLYLMPLIAQSAVSCIARGNSFASVVGVWALAGLGLCVLALTYHTVVKLVRTMRCDEPATLSSKDLVSEPSWLRPQYSWTARDAADGVAAERICASFGAYFEDFVYHGRWWLSVDVVTALASGIIGGLQGSGLSCTVIQGMAVVPNAAYLALLLAVRPHQRRLDFGVATIVGTLLLLSSAALFVGLTFVSTTAALAASVAAFVPSLVAPYKVLQQYRALRRMRRKRREHEARVRGSRLAVYDGLLDFADEVPERLPTPPPSVDTDADDGLLEVPIVAPFETAGEETQALRGNGQIGFLLTALSSGPTISFADLEDILNGSPKRDKVDEDYALL